EQYVSSRAPLENPEGWLGKPRCFAYDLPIAESDFWERPIAQSTYKMLGFSRFALDLRRGCLRAGEQEIDLSPKAFKVLCHLVENVGRLVPKQELYDAVWPIFVVSDDSLVQCIGELRQKLGAADRRLIKTLSRRGYLLDARISAYNPSTQ